MRLIAHDCRVDAIRKSSPHKFMTTVQEAIAMLNQNTASK